jgi:hypothetical protein
MEPQHQLLMELLLQLLLLMLKMHLLIKTKNN